MILHWRQKRPDLTIQWRGPNKITNKAITSFEEITNKIAVISGPQGQQGQPGAPGPKGEKGDAAVYDETIPLVLDGGNF